MLPFRWLPEHVAKIGTQAHSVAPEFSRSDVPDILRGHDFWDHWPVLQDNGSLAAIAGGLLVIALTAPKAPDPEDRHHIARLRLFHLTADNWRDLGPLLPPNLSAGTREWSGSATLSRAGDRLNLFFTVAGRKGEAVLSYTQRLFETGADLQLIKDTPSLSNWQQPAESVAADGMLYETQMAGGAAIGTIKAFRDPFFVRDCSGNAHLLFTASDPAVDSCWNGVIGVASKTETVWKLLPPLVRADDLNNELERPHVVVHDGLVYLFWSTQAKVFKVGGPIGPTGLYGVVADRWGDPWRPLNGSGLVFGNPDSAPSQSYSFQVLPNLSVWSFADMPGAPDIPRDAKERRAAFVGGPAPMLRVWLDGSRAGLVVP